MSTDDKGRTANVYCGPTQIREILEEHQSTSVCNATKLKSREKEKDPLFSFMYCKRFRETKTMLA
jgi:hypothetical protein